MGVRAVGLWIAILLAVGVVAAARDQGSARSRRAVSANTERSTDETTSTQPPPPPLLLISRIAPGTTTGAAFTVDPGTGAPTTSAQPPIPRKQIAADGTEVIAVDQSQSTTPATTCGIGGCQSGYTVFQASDLVLVGPAGARRTLASGGYDRAPSWSPDGELIAYVSHRRGDHGPERDVAALIGRDGVSRGTVTPPDASDTVLAWSPDGQSIVTVRAPIDRPTEQSVVITTVRDGAARTITDGRYSELAWSPDGRWIAGVQVRVDRRHPESYPDGYPFGSDLWLLPAAPAAGDTPIQLSSYGTEVTIYGGGVPFWCTDGGFIPTVSTPVWSRDDQLAFLTNAPHALRYGHVFDAAIADLGGAEPRIVYQSPPDTCAGDPRAYADVHVEPGGTTELLGWV